MLASFRFSRPMPLIGAHQADSAALCRGGQSARLARRERPRCCATARSRSRLTAKNRPRNRPPIRLGLEGNRSGVEGDMRTDCIGPRRHSLAASVDPTEAPKATVRCFGRSHRSTFAQSNLMRPDEGASEEPDCLPWNRNRVTGFYACERIDAHKKHCRWPSSRLSTGYRFPADPD